MEFKWLNESTIKKTGDRIEIKAPGQTDLISHSITLWMGIIFI